MGSFSVTARSFVSGIKVQAIGPAKDGSWTIHATRDNYVEAEQLNSAVATIALVPAENFAGNSSNNRRAVSIPEACSTVIVSVGIGTIATDETCEFLGIEIKNDSKEGDNSRFSECFRIGDL